MTRRWTAQLLIVVLTQGAAAPAFAARVQSARTYDKDGRVQSVTAPDGKLYRYDYDAEGSAFISGPGGHLVAIEIKDGTVVAYAYADTGALVETRITKPGSAPQYIGHTAGTAVTETGDPQPFGFAGEVRDRVTGLHQHRERWYDPATGRFLSPDPEPGVPSSPVTFHPYGYANADPVNKTDPSGRYTIGQLAIASGIITGLASASVTAYRGGSTRDIVQAGTVTGFTAAVAVYYGVPVTIASTIVYSALRQYPYLLGPMLSRSVTPASLRTLANLRRVSPRDAEIIAQAMRYGAGSPHFEAHMAATIQALRLTIPDGQLYPLGTYLGSPVYGSTFTGVGLVSLGGVTHIVRMRGGEFLEMLGPWH